jgi:hypothetical protein
MKPIAAAGLPSPVSLGSAAGALGCVPVWVVWCGVCLRLRGGMWQLRRPTWFGPGGGLVWFSKMAELEFFIYFLYCAKINGPFEIL